MNIALASIPALVFLAILIEAVVEQLKDMLPTMEGSTIRLMSFGVGLLLAFVLKINLFEEAAGSIYWAGVFLAGLICSRGSNYVHDLFSMFAKVGDAAEARETDT